MGIAFAVSVSEFVFDKGNKYYSSALTISKNELISCWSIA